MIKKTAALSLAAFYLLLTTGMFVCLMHCATESVMAKPGMQMAGMSDHQHKSHCDTGQGCDCCKHHGSFVIKENLKPGFDYQVGQQIVLLPQFVPGEYISRMEVTDILLQIDDDSPPWVSGKALSIKLRSLRI